MGAHVRKRHVSTISGVGGSKADVLVIPGRCDVRSHCSSVSMSPSWTYVNVVVVVVDHFTRNYGSAEYGM